MKITSCLITGHSLDYCLMTIMPEDTRLFKKNFFSQLKSPLTILSFLFYSSMQLVMSTPWVKLSFKNTFLDLPNRLEFFVKTAGEKQIWTSSMETAIALQDFYLRDLVNCVH